MFIGRTDVEPETPILWPPDAKSWGAMETVTDFILGGSKITADGEYCHEIRRHLLLGGKL